jgi:hypothetical protein
MEYDVALTSIPNESILARPPSQLSQLVTKSGGNPRVRRFML